MTVRTFLSARKPPKKDAFSRVCTAFLPSKKWAKNVKIGGFISSPAVIVPVALESSFQLESSFGELTQRSGFRSIRRDGVLCADSSERMILGPENSLLKAFLPDNISQIESIVFPLAIFGPSGSGKSLLSRLIASKLNPDNRIITENSNDFYRDFVDAIELDDLQDFRRRLIEPCCEDNAIFILDNLEDIISRPAVFEELVYFLDHCPRMIITSSRNPSELSELSPRIVSRLMSGLSIPLHTPDVPTRSLIIDYYLSRLDASIQRDAAVWLAENVATSVPEILKTIALLKIHLDLSRPIRLKSVTSIFKSDASNRPTIAEIAKTVARYQSMRIADLKSQSRKRTNVLARGIAVFIARETFHYKYEELGRYFGNRDHSTIMHAHRKFLSEMNADPELHLCVNQLTEKLQSSRG